MCFSCISDDGHKCANAAPHDAVWQASCGRNVRIVAVDPHGMFRLRQRTSDRIFVEAVSGQARSLGNASTSVKI